MNHPIDNAHLALLIANSKTNYNLLIDAQRQSLSDYINALLDEGINTLLEADAAILLDKNECLSFLDSLESGLLLKAFFLVFNGHVVPRTMDEAINTVKELMVARDKIDDALSILVSIHATINNTKTLLD
jgi:hypothetical protein